MDCEYHRSSARRQLFQKIKNWYWKPKNNIDMISYVLKKAPRKDREELMLKLHHYLDLGERIILDGWQKTVMKYHSSEEEEEMSLSVNCRAT